ncbi:MAG TPA: hypothetical protein VFV39_09385 [Limnobacter sp.]|nr:hypothetical protein [Limnobacter sp.]
MRALRATTFATLTLALGACSAPAPDSMDKMANGNIVQINGLNTDELTFVTRNRIVNLFATDAYNIMRDMKRYYTAEFNSHPTLSVQAVTELKNTQTGEVLNNQPLFTVSWRRPDLNQMDLDSKFSLDTEEILLYADRVVSHGVVGDQVLIDHCTVSSNTSKRERFCDLVVEGLHAK